MGHYNLSSIPSATIAWLNVLDKIAAFLAVTVSPTLTRRRQSPFLRKNYQPSSLKLTLSHLPWILHLIFTKLLAHSMVLILRKLGSDALRLFTWFPTCPDFSPPVCPVLWGGFSDHRLWVSSKALSLTSNFLALNSYPFSYDCSVTSNWKACIICAISCSTVTPTSVSRTLPTNSPRLQTAWSFLRSPTELHQLSSWWCSQKSPNPVRSFIKIVSIFILFILLNLLRWHWSMELYRFQVYSSLRHHLYIALCSSAKVKSSVSIYLTHLTIY